MSNVSASGFTPYFFAIVGSENSERGIKATEREERNENTERRTLRHTCKTTL
jgi:hypothetical protein